MANRQTATPTGALLMIEQNNTVRCDGISEDVEVFIPSASKR
jgi:hypothetical protein